MLGYCAVSCSNCSPTFLYNVLRRKESWHREVMTKVLALTADRVEREGWIERRWECRELRLMGKRME